MLIPKLVASCDSAHHLSEKTISVVRLHEAGNNFSKFCGQDIRSHQGNLRTSIGQNAGSNRMTFCRICVQQLHRKYSADHSCKFPSQIDCVEKTQIQALSTKR